jgi:hypothetical protein
MEHVQIPEPLSSVGASKCVHNVLNACDKNRRVKQSVSVSQGSPPLSAVSTSE